MNRFLVYDTVSGAIRKYGMARDTAEDEGASMADQAGDGDSWLAIDEFPDAAASYVVEGTVTARPACPVTAAIVGRIVTLSGVPAGAAYNVSGAASLAGTADASGTLELTFGTAGTYQIAVACFPALDFVQGVTLT